MPRTPTKNYLRKYRLEAALSQSEAGGLLGVSKNALSRYELGMRVPPAEVVAASEIVFGVDGAAIFPALYNGVGEELFARVLMLRDRLGEKSDPAAQKKRALMNGIERRLS